MGKAKWIAGFLGWVAWGPIGALLGFVAGAFLDAQIDFAKQLNGSGGDAAGTASRQRGYTADEQRNSFLVSLLVLSSAVIKADGQVRQAELDHVRQFVRQNFGEQAVSEAMQILERLNRQQVDIYSVGAQIAGNMN